MANLHLSVPHTSNIQSQTPAKLSARDLAFYYGDFKAIKELSLDVPENKVTALIGPSGCGKSTLLRVFNRIYSLYPKQRATGTVMLDGENIIDPNYPLNKLRSKVGMVFQKPVPFPMSIYDNIAYGISHYEKLSNAEMDVRVEGALREGALWEEVKDKLKQSALGLSGGQQQRLCIARAVALKPEVILFDEPTSALDPIATGKIEQLISELKQQFTILIVTHNMQQAARVSDFTAFIHVSRRTDRAWRDRNHIHQTHQEADRRLHHRPIRLRIPMNTHDHILKSFDSELDRLYDEIKQMGDLAISQLNAAVDVLGRRDSNAAARVVANDDAIDALENAISMDVLKLLALRQPMARDLREVYSALRISSDIERIGDYASNVAKRSIVLNNSPAIPAAGRIARLAKTASALLSDALKAYAESDAELAAKVRDADADLDAMYTSFFRELVTYMMEDPRTIGACTHLMFMAKNIERIGDHATNIAENTWFVVHGDMPEGERKKEDRTSE